MNGIIENSIYKIYTGILAEFITDHCKENNLITEEQAAGKRGSWGCTDELLVNKMICKEVTVNRRNLITVWLDYRKAFDSVPHDWVIKSLQLAKVPTIIIQAIQSLMNKWKTRVHLYGESNTIETKLIDYYRGILQGDLLSLILFVLAVNPLSYLLSKEDGIRLSIEDQIRIISHLFFVDDLKLFASSLARMEKLLDIVTQFTNDVGMTFGEAKCAYQAIQRGKRIEYNQPLKMNGLTVKEIENGDHYTYLGMDESIGILGPLNKDRVKKEYKTRLNKIWQSELNGRNKTIAHNTFAIPNDVGMTFGEAKCAYQAIQRGKRIEYNQPLKMNGLTVKEIENGDHYTYLGMDESIGILGPLNKDRVKKEYKTRLNKIWQSELNGRNKTIAHNTFAIPIITPTVGILDWTKKEIKDLDIMTRKMISMNGGFHLASDVNRLYTSRTKGGRGITSIEDMYESRTIGIMKHLEEASDTNSLIQMVRKSENNNVMRLGKEFEKRVQEGQGTGKVTDSMRKDHEKKWKEKVTHGYLQSQIEKDDTIDQNATDNWLQQRFSAHLE